MNLYETIKNNLKESDDVYINDTKVAGNGGVHTGVLKSIVDRNKSKISDILSNWNINSISYQENVDSDQSYGGVIIDATNKQDSRYTTATTFWLMLEANDSCFIDCYQVLEFTNGDDFESLVDDDSIHQLVSNETLGMRELIAEIESILISLIKKVYSDFDDIISYRIKNNLNEATDMSSETSFDIDDFEQEIPHNMRWKYKEELDDNYIYWVTQEPFTKKDLQQFVDKLKPYHLGAYVTVRDLSSYDVDRDYDAGVLAHIDKNGKITHFDDYWEQASHWFNEADAPTIKLSDTYKVIDVPKGNLTATPSIAREINRKSLDKEKYGILMKAVDDIITAIGSDKEQLKDLRDDVYSEFNRALGLKESEKLNEGAQSFARSGEGNDAREVFNKLVDEAYYEYGHDPYNGTISTTDFNGSVIKIADTYSEEVDAKAREYIENDGYGEKWVSKCLDLGELPDQPGVHRYVFYGWAAI